MQKSYGIVEPKILNPIFSNPRYCAFAVPIMTWLCELLRSELPDHAEHVEFEVICVTYLGSYPAIGLHYKEKGYKDIRPIVEAAVDRILQKKSALEFIGFISEREIDWNELTAKIMSKRS